MGSAAAEATYRLLHQQRKEAALSSALPGIEDGEEGWARARRAVRRGGASWEDPADDEDRKPKTLKGHIRKFLKIALPHVIIISATLTYITLGALTFKHLEKEPELARESVKASQTQELHERILAGASSKGEVESALRNLSQLHGYITAPKDVYSKWTFPGAAVYSLTVISTTGYDHISPSTDAGKIFTVVYGLFGIPLLFITAADIGKFLSDGVTRAYAAVCHSLAWLKRKVEALFCPPKRKAPSEGGSQNGEAEAAAEQALAEEEPIRLPLASYFVLTLGYCAFGSAVFTQFEKATGWNFLHGFFFCFNTITTVGIGNIRIPGLLYLATTISYAIVGLSVITMCIDLASGQIKTFFAKLHYAGRKMPGVGSLSEDARNAARLVSKFWRQNRLTVEDLRRILRLQKELDMLPYIPLDFDLLQWIDEEIRNSALNSQAQTPRSRAGTLARTNSEPTLRFVDA